MQKDYLKKKRKLKTERCSRRRKRFIEETRVD